MRTLTDVTRRIVLGLAVAFAVLVPMALYVILLNLTVYLEASVPPERDLPDLPSGLSMANENASCGSGQCFREFDVVGDPGDSPESIIKRLPARECSAHSLVDRRPLCVGYEIRGDVVTGFVTLGKWYGQ